MRIRAIDDAMRDYPRFMDASKLDYVLPHLPPELASTQIDLGGQNLGLLINRLYPELLNFYKIADSQANPSP